MTESFATLVGVSNIATEARSRFPAGPDPDAEPGLRDRLLTRARRALEGREAFIHDAVLLGRRVRLYSNSFHLADFWRDNLETEAAWMERTGRPVDREPALTVYALIRVDGERQSSYFASTSGEVYLFNTSYYADLRACTMEAAARQLGVRLLHAGVVDAGARPLVLLYPDEIIHPTPVWGLMERPAARFLADGWVAADAEGRIEAVERRLYVRCSLIRDYPALAARFLRAKFENVPNPAPALLERQTTGAREILTVARKHDPGGALRHLPEDRALETFARLTATDDARALVDPVALFGRSRVTRGPLAPSAVFALRAGEGKVFTETTVEGFACPAWEVRVGAVPGHPRELALQISAR